MPLRHFIPGSLIPESSSISSGLSDGGNYHVHCFLSLCHPDVLCYRCVLRVKYVLMTPRHSREEQAVL
jgi:hypothetical protein